MNVPEKIRNHGLLGSIRLMWQSLFYAQYLAFKWRRAPLYVNPTQAELDEIEKGLFSLGTSTNPITMPPGELQRFQKTFRFPRNYYNGTGGKVRDEKILEHFIAYKLAGLEAFSHDDIYIDIAGGASPWANLLRENGYKAYSVDLQIKPEHKGLPYYLEEDAKATSFQDTSIRACSLQCAYEMFVGEDDVLFLQETQRVLKPGGVAIISPLYLHTHHCGYSSLEYYRKGYADLGAKEYICKKYWGIPFSRKYSPELLKKRILNRIEEHGMKYTLFKLMNKSELGDNIYCHFILRIEQN
ncbi:MAG: methyltransferase domain-containing protein [Deltaproteobacteria bacterium]|jgi:ubiquinone/menaquinone biosynthesis C-methylase UbiE